MFSDYGLCDLPEEGTHRKSLKCLGGNLGDFGGILQRSQYIKFTTTKTAFTEGGFLLYFSYYEFG